MRNLWLILLVVPASAQIAGLQVAGITHTQAILSYVAPDDSACLLEISESPSYSPVVNDVNGALFPGASSDTRSLTSGAQRIVVIGKRRAETGTGGKLYSRALAADTPHYVRVTCGASQATTQFVTRTVPWGDTFPEPPPFNPDGFGNYGWPTIDWSDRNKEYIDPLTGVKLKLLGAPGMRGNRYSAAFTEDYWWDWSGGSWTNPQNAVSGTTSALASTSAAGAPLFVAINPAGALPFGEIVAGWAYNRTVDDLGLQVFGSGTDSSATNRTVRVCLSLDSGQSCASGTIDVALPQGSAKDNGLFPSTFPRGMFGSWGDRPIGRWEWPRAGQVTVAGHTVTLVANNSGGAVDDAAAFDPRWPGGAKIWIQGTHPACPHNLCTVTSVQSFTSLTIEQSLNLPAGTPYRSANFGFRVVKGTGTGTVSMSFRHTFAWSYVTWHTATGGDERCSRVPVTTAVDRNGSPSPAQRGYLCILPLPAANDSAAPVVWIGEESGEVRLISNMRKPASISGHSFDDLPYAPAPDPGGTFTAFDPAQGNVWYVNLPVNGVDAQGARKRSIFKLVYTGDYREYKPNYPASSGDDQNNAPPDSVTWLNIAKATQNRDIQSQIEANLPSYNRARYGNVGLNSSAVRDATSNYLVVTHNIGAQDGPCWVFFFDLTTGNFVKGFNSWDGAYHPELRWGGCHAAQATGLPGYASISHVPLKLFNANSLYGGPFEAQVSAVKRPGGWDTSNTSVSGNIGDSSYDAACPDDLPQPWKDLGATGNRCLTIRLLGEPCSNWATANEKIWNPCPWDNNRSMLQPIAEGDLVYNRNAQNPIDSERLRVVRKTSLDGGQFELVLHRNGFTGNTCGQLLEQRAHAHGWSITMGVPSGCQASGKYVAAAPQNNEVLAEHMMIVSQGHWDYGPGATPGTYKIVSSTNGRESGPLSEIGQPPRLFWSIYPAFDGARGLSSGLQSYPSIRQWNAAGAERYWELNFHHTEFPGNITMTLESGTTSVYRLNILGQSVDLKRLPVTAYAGQYLLKDKSGPGSLLTDSDPWRYCYARTAGECRPGSQAGQFFVAVPNASLGTTCPEVWYRTLSFRPCAFSGVATAAWVAQRDFDFSKAQRWRKISMGFSGPMRQYPFANARALPNGKWAILPGYWLDGVRSDLLLAKLPRAEPFDDADRSRYSAVRVKVSPVDGATQAVIDFGYEEFGNPADFHCTTRSERCAVPGLSPFSYASETVQPAACAGGCSIDVPAVPSRVLYYRVRYLNAGGELVKTGPLQAIAAP